ncbi:hypothetical protein [Rubrivirga marina]|uniref:TolC family protein n=1 Tax=Rubrivirga marina TaxID=1196024 RepID=A0A271ISP3_9BACT|nr:hypothetical protein [Rubrivirga marina]PAP74223.1 hypothetical protein BSZ37_21415 [Rubrivirga marina]
MRLSALAATLALLLAALAPSALAQSPASDAADALAALADTTEATAEASLRVETARLTLARSELRQATHWSRLRPQVDLYLSVSTRGLAFPSISTQGYDPVYAAIARWPGDSWGLTVSWTLDQLLDRRPLHRARAAVAVAEARVDLHHARAEARRERDRQRAVAQAEREAEEARREAERERRARAARALLAADAPFLEKRLDAQRELLRLAEMTYEQGETDYAALARQRLAVLDAERALALHAARRDALDATGDPDLALADRRARAPR